ncbi:hypothetical protein HU751_018960 [Pseudomonas sp. BW13M1]|uniref:Uncharacterized protein n=1 Tax=Pseudomonas peradeniyensis TaxID=2745488 RepID=A0A923GDC9_9PSED|nr:hypothetical protein [Pseudomonas peradeniyensis]MBV4506913.1 hypothetical protein [Pseudomonas peradeniyensis]
MRLYLVASLLARGCQLERLSDGLTLLALACTLAPLLGLPLAPLPHLLCGLLLLLGLVHKYWALRVALDADLFAHLGASSDLPADTQDLDHALFDLRLKPAPNDPRDWPTRSRAALALLRRQALCLALQVALMLTLPFTG